MSLSKQRLSSPELQRTPPRPLEPAELAGLLRVADVLIPGSDELPCASEAPDFTGWLGIALAARADKFDVIVATGMSFAGTPASELGRAVRSLSEQQPEVFQPLSAVLAGAYLMVPEIRAAIGYPGQHASRPSLNRGVLELMDGILEPVLERGNVYTAVPGQYDSHA